MIDQPLLPFSLAVQAHARACVSFDRVSATFHIYITDTAVLVHTPKYSTYMIQTTPSYLPCTIVCLVVCRMTCMCVLCCVCWFVCV